MNIADQAKQQKIALNAILAEIQEQLKYFQGPKFYTDTSVQTHEITSRLRTLKEQAEKGLEGVTIKSGDDYDSGMNIDSFHWGDTVDVHAYSTDEFHDFTGKIIMFNYTEHFMMVKDQEDNVFSVLPIQCSFPADDKK